MLTNQIIGAGQNVASHTMRPVVPADTSRDSPSTIAVGSAKPTEQVTQVAILPQTKSAKADTGAQDRPTLQTPKKVDLKVAVPGTIPDVQPESIFKAQTAEPSPDEAT